MLRNAIRRSSLNKENKISMKSFIQLVPAIALLVLLGALSRPMQGEVAVADAPRIRVPKVSKAPRLEDYLNGNQRIEELRISEFRQREPNDGGPPKLQTTAYLSYDDVNLYAIFVCQGKRTEIRANMNRREDIEEDDHVILNLDSFHDRRHAYEFFVNPLGIQRDGLITEGQDDDFTFDTVWQSRGQFTPNGYVVWMAIPFKRLRFSRDPGRTWGIALGRYTPASNEFSTWPYLTERMEAYVPQFATLESMEGTSPGRNIQVIPYAFYSGQKFLNNSAFENHNEFRGGVDAKFVARNGLTFDFTANPDFSQIESDEPQVTINQRYEVFFPEKRPFFTESAGFFQTPEDLFFSRRIADPQFGARMTGKVGDWALGALAIDDRAPGEVLDPADPLFQDHAQIGVLRAQRDIGKESTAGVFLSRLHFGSSSNEVLSADTRLKLSPNWVLTGQLMRAWARDLDGQRSSGTGLFTEIRHTGRHFTYYTNYRDRSPNLEVDLGFIPRVDIRQVRNSAGYQWRPENGKVVSFGPELNTLIDWDHQGRLQDWSFDLPFSLQLKRSTTLSVGHTQVYERFQDIPFHEQATYAYVSTQPWRILSLNSSFIQGTNVNYFPAQGLLPFLASSSDASAGITLRPSSRLRVEETYLYDRLGTLSNPKSAGVPSSAAIFNNHLLRTKFSYQFNRSFSLRAIVDVNLVLANAQLVDLDQTKRVTTDILFTYLLHPGTAIYVGYNNTRENLGLNPVGGVGRVNSPSLTTQRQFFIKLSYLFRF
jgi:hypothetical protein